VSAKSLPASSDVIVQTLSAQSLVPIASTVSSKSQKDGSWIFLQAIAQRFPLPWSHYVRLLSARSDEARAFYEAEALRGGWSVRQLDRQINSLFYERTALSKDKAAMLKKGAKAEPGEALTAEEAIRDPLVLEFLNLKDEETAPNLATNSFIYEASAQIRSKSKYQKSVLDNPNGSPKSRSWQVVFNMKGLPLITASILW
jgi:hypothetical protein